MPLVRRNGKLLRRNGKLASGIECCECDPPPEECPPCCIRITWGAFDEDGNLIASVTAGEATVLVKVIVPTPHSRIVCDEDEITVQWEITGHEGTGSNDAWMRFGPAWLVTGHSPAVNAGNGKVYDWGLVDWGNVEDDTYSVTLQFRRCFLDVTDFLGYIWIGMANPEMEEEIEIERCETTEWCCRDEYECQKCCALLDMGGVIQHDGKFYKVTQVSDANGIFTGIVEIVLEDEEGIICKGQGLTLNVYLVPPRHGIAPDNNMVIEHPAPWIQSNHTPAINPVDGEATETKTDWGTLNDTEYSISLGIDCEDWGIELEFPSIDLNNSDYGFSTSVGFTECDVADCCENPCDLLCEFQWRGPPNGYPTWRWVMYFDSCPFDNSPCLCPDDPSDEEGAYDGETRFFNCVPQ